MAIVYVTTGAWGSGTGAILNAAQVDGNFYDVDQRIETLVADLDEGKRIESIASGFNSMTITFTDASTQVIPLPIASLNFVGQWQNSTPYTRGQLITVPTLGLFQVLEDHTTPALPAVFDANAVTDDTDADPLYAFLLPVFSINLPGGTAGQVVTKVDSTDFNIEWSSLTADVIVFDPPTGSTLTSTNVADALEELSEATFAASSVTFDSSTDITSTNVQAAIEEVFGAIASPDLSAYAPLASPALTGNPTAPTQSVGNSSTRLATTAFVAGEVGNSIQAYDAQLSSLVRQNSKSAAYTTVLSDGGKHILHPSADTTARTFTIDSNANVAYPIGTAITFVNQHSGGVVTIAITSDTMRLAGAGTTGSRTLAADGVATALKITSTEWIISGTGLT